MAHLQGILGRDVDGLGGRRVSFGMYPRAAVRPDTPWTLSYGLQGNAGGAPGRWRHIRMGGPLFARRNYLFCFPRSAPWPWRSEQRRHNWNPYFHRWALP